jgi:hypothetical protein
VNRFFTACVVIFNERYTGAKIRKWGCSSGINVQSLQPLKHLKAYYKKRMMSMDEGQTKFFLDPNKNLS